MNILAAVKVLDQVTGLVTNAAQRRLARGKETNAMTAEHCVGVSYDYFPVIQEMLWCEGNLILCGACCAARRYGVV